jgi:hypothetical protein
LSGEDIRDISLVIRDVALCNSATYMHLGRKAAMILAPSTIDRSDMAVDARLRLVMALLSEGVSAHARRRYSGTYVHLGRKAATMWLS